MCLVDHPNNMNEDFLPKLSCLSLGLYSETWSHLSERQSPFPPLTMGIGLSFDHSHAFRLDPKLGTK